jgi:predicted RNase H-like nuclease
VQGALEQLDLTALVIAQIDLGDLVSAALQQVDLTEIVRQQVDLLGLAEYVVEGIDLPEIIRDSTGSVASEAVVGMRMQGIDADAAVGRVVDRVLRRRRQHRTGEAPGEPDSTGGSADPPPGTPE